MQLVRQNEARPTQKPLQKSCNGDPEWCWTSITALPIASDGKQDELCFTKTRPEGTNEMKKEKNTIIGTEAAAEP